MTVVSLIPAYTGVRLGLWLTLWVAVHVDAFCNRSSRGRGWRLHRGILAFLTTEVVYQFLHFSVVVHIDSNGGFEDGDSDSGSKLAESNAFKVEIFFNWLAQSVFLCLILLVSVGYCILRDHLGESLRKVVVIPVVYGVTSMIFDFILVSSSNEQVVTQQTEEDEDDELDSEALKGLILITCLLVKAVVFVCAWVFVFEHLNREIRLLRGEEDEAEPDREEGDAGETGYSRPELQSRVEDPTSPDTEPKTVADVVGDRAKLRLLTRFRASLIIYVVTMILVNVLPLYIGNSSVEKIQSVITVCENVILFVFTATLALIFRPMTDNPYLLLVDNLDAAGQEKEVTTELGVISFEPPTPQQATMVLPELKHEDKEREAPTFDLADDEDMDLMSPQRRDTVTATTPAAASPTARSSTPTLSLSQSKQDPHQD